MNIAGSVDIFRRLLCVSFSFGFSPCLRISLVILLTLSDAVYFLMGRFDITAIVVIYVRGSFDSAAVTEFPALFPWPRFSAERVDAE